VAVALAGTVVRFVVSTGAAAADATKQNQCSERPIGAVPNPILEVFLLMPGIVARFNPNTRVLRVSVDGQEVPATEVFFAEAIVGHYDCLVKTPYYRLTTPGSRQAVEDKKAVASTIYPSLLVVSPK
jgi:hypothetical protein